LKDQADVKNNTKMDLAENLGYKNGRWIYLAQNHVQQWILVLVV
jgi:hypothetical protein